VAGGPHLHTTDRSVSPVLSSQDETWRVGRLRPWPHCVRWISRSPYPKGHSGAPAPNFWPTSIMAKRSPISATAEHLFVLALFAFVVLGLVSSVLHQEIGWEEHLPNDPFNQSMQWHVAEIQDVAGSLACW